MHLSLPSAIHFSSLACVLPSGLRELSRYFRGKCNVMTDSILQCLTHISLLYSPVYFLQLCIRRDRARGTVCFFLGIVLVVMRWGLIGMALEAFGFLNLFGNFLPTVLTVARQLPGLRTILEFPLISQAADFIAGKTRPKYSVQFPRIIVTYDEFYMCCYI